MNNNYNKLAKALLLLLFLSLSSVSSWAAPISPEKALVIAQRFWTRPEVRSEVQSNLSDQSVSLVYTKHRTGLRSSDSDVSYYVFNRGVNQGYVIISGDDRLDEVLGYAFVGAFDSTDQPDAMKAWLACFDQLSAVQLQSFSPRSGSTRSQRSPIAPMLDVESIQWGQDYPYNDMCPSDEQRGMKCVTGCPATALAQVMRYHKWPDQGVGRHVYHDYSIDYSVDIVREIKFGTSYDWDHMLGTFVGDPSRPTYQKEVNAVAHLLKEVGLAVSTQYSGVASGAWEGNVLYAIQHFFKYRRDAELVSRDQVDDSAFDAMLYEELSKGRPVIYFGTGRKGGHAFVCDGYDKDGYYHFNWGWNGKANGFFKLSALNPKVLGVGGGGGAFNFAQVILKGIAPDRSGSSVMPELYTTPYVSLRVHGAMGDGGAHEAVVLASLVQKKEAISRLQYVRAVMRQGDSEVITSEDQEIKLALQMPSRIKECRLPLDGLADGVYSIELEVRSADETVYKPLQQLSIEPSKAFVRVANGEVAEVTYDVRINPIEVVAESVKADIKAFDSGSVSVELRNVGDHEYYAPVALYCFDAQMVSDESFIPGATLEPQGYQPVFIAPGQSVRVTFDEVRTNIADQRPASIYLQWAQVNPDEPSDEIGYFFNDFARSPAHLVSKDCIVQLPDEYKDVTLVSSTKGDMPWKIYLGESRLQGPRIEVENRGEPFVMGQFDVGVRGMLTLSDEGKTYMLAWAENALSRTMKKNETYGYIPWFRYTPDYEDLVGKKGFIRLHCIEITMGGSIGKAFPLFGTTMIPVEFLAGKKPKGLEEVSGDQCIAYPNPTQDFTTVASDESIEYLYVFNASGAIIQQQAVDGVSAELNMSTYPSGVYYVKLLFANGVSRVLTIQVTK